MKKLFDTHNWFLVNKNWPDKKAKEKKCNLRKTKLHWNTGRLRSKKQLSGGVKTNKVFFQQPAAESLQETVHSLHVKKMAQQRKRC